MASQAPVQRPTTSRGRRSCSTDHVSSAAVLTADVLNQEGACDIVYKAYRRPTSSRQWPSYPATSRTGPAAQPKDHNSKRSAVMLADPDTTTEYHQLQKPRKGSAVELLMSAPDECQQRHPKIISDAELMTNSGWRVADARDDVSVDSCRLEKGSDGTGGYEGAGRPRTSGGSQRQRQQQHFDMNDEQSSQQDWLDVDRVSRQGSHAAAGQPYGINPSPPYSNSTSSTQRPRPTSGYQSNHAGKPPSCPATGRPDSATSLSKYPVLPRIGAKDTSRQVEVAGVNEALFSPTTAETHGGFSAALATDIQRFKLTDMEASGSGEASPPTEQRDQAARKRGSKQRKPQAVSKKNSACKAGNHSSGTNPSLEKQSDATNSDLSPSSMLKPLKHDVKLPPEPKATGARILLAIKLHTGLRVQRYFSPTDTLMTVLNFAEISANVDYTGHELVCGTPQKLFSDLRLQIKDSGIENKTVLHIQYPDE